MKKKSILLVEDNPHDEMLTTRLLEQQGIFTEIMVVRDGEEALDNLLRDGDQASEDKAKLPAVILLDLNLPKVHGLEVLRSLRAHPLTKILPVVVFTSSIEESDVTAAYQLGANSYIQKSINFDEFSESVRLVSEYWGALNTYPSA
jgi:two-component system response regulator